jgi:hypothetical protein
MISVDFEFFNTTSEFVELVCCTTVDDVLDEVNEWWLLDNPEEKAALKKYLLSKKDQIFEGYATVAESRSFIALGLDPVAFKWIDQFLEFRCLTNHNDELNWGEQLVDGKVRTTKKPPPKWERSEEDQMNSFKHTHSLAEATFKLTGEIRDTEEKDRMRDIIISGDKELINKHADEIQQYCTLDTVFLPKIRNAIIAEYKRLGVKYDGTLIKEMLGRGEYAALTAWMETWGYPIDYDATKNFSDSVDPLMEDCQREINRLFPHIKPFKYKKVKGVHQFTWDQTATKKWLKENVDMDRWMKTDSYKKAMAAAKKARKPLENPEKYLSLSGDAWQKVFDFKHEYPKDNFGAQMVRYLKLKKDLNGFVIKPGKRNFWDSVGPDKRVRPYFNIFGSQSSRSQPSSRGYLFLKPAWMRSLCRPPKGKAIASFDYGSEEFLISALISACQNMKDAYISGDVYLYFGKLIGLIPWEGTKATHKYERNLCKALVLGISYLMTAKGLAGHLTNNLGKPFTEQEAQELIDQFYEAYEELGDWQEEIIEQYENEGRIKLPCGWYVWGDNDNFRSVANVPIQGVGASIMRKAVKLCYDNGLRVILTLHDALYIEYDEGDFAALDTFHRCMKEAFVHFFPEDRETAAQIKLDGYTWSSSYPEVKLVEDEKEKGKYNVVCESITTPGGLEIDVGHIYIDERSTSEYLQFSKYFKKRNLEAL